MLSLSTGRKGRISQIRIVDVAIRRAPLQPLVAVQPYWKSCVTAYRYTFTNTDR